jgi:SAM-dependent methyltransferase
MLPARLSSLLEPPTPRLDWEESDCLLCGSGDWRPVIEAPERQDPGLRFLIVQCQHCGLCFTNPRPSPASIAQFYDDDYAPHQPKPEKGPPTRWWNRLPFFHRPSLRQNLPLQGQSRLLDFGCGDGAFLRRMRRLGWNVTGLDLSHAAVDRLRRDNDLTVYQGSLPHPELLPDSFDVVTMWQALEHAHRPLEVLQAAHGLLARGGKLIVTAPNIESLPFRWFGPAWFGLDLPRHLTHFSPPTLRHMLHQAGFQPSRVRLLRRSAWLRRSAQLAEPKPSPRWLTFLRSRVGANLASWYCYFGRLSDCMMVTGLKT